MDKKKRLLKKSALCTKVETAGQDEMLEKERLIKKCNLFDKSFVLCYVINNEAQHERKNQNHQQHSGLCPQSQRRASLPLPFL